MNRGFQVGIKNLSRNFQVYEGGLRYLKGILRKIKIRNYRPVAVGERYNAVCYVVFKIGITNCFAELIYPVAAAQLDIRKPVVDGQKRGNFDIK